MFIVSIIRKIRNAGNKMVVFLKETVRARTIAARMTVKGSLFMIFFRDGFL